MNEIRRIARVYYREFEGLSLYPSPKTSLFWIWTLSVFAMFSANAGYLYLFSSLPNPNWWILIPALSDLIALRMLEKVDEHRNAQIKKILSKKMGADFDSTDSWKTHRLSQLLGVRSEHFLKAAEDIHSMRSVLAAFQSKAQATNSKSIFRHVYDASSKDRITNLILVLVGVIVTLAATSQANLENLFEAYDSPGFWALIALLAMFATMMFSFWMFAVTMALIVGDMYQRWRARFSMSLLGDDFEVGYLVGDLVRLHRRPPLSRIRIKGPGSNYPLLREPGSLL